MLMEPADRAGLSLVAAAAAAAHTFLLYVFQLYTMEKSSTARWPWNSSHVIVVVVVVCLFNLHLSD